MFGSAPLNFLCLAYAPCPSFGPWPLTRLVAVPFRSHLGPSLAFVMSLAALSRQVGPHAGPCLALLGIPPSAPEGVLAQISEPFLIWALTSVGLPQEDFPPTRAWFRAELIRLRTAPIVSPVTVPVTGTCFSPTWAALHPRPAPNHTWLEVMAAGVPVSAAVVAYSLGLIFLESQTLEKYNRAVGLDPARVCFSFADRAFASGCQHLIPALDLDQSVSAKGTRRWSEPPRKRLASHKDALAGGPAPASDPRMVRSPEALAREAGLRSMAASVLNGWPAYASGLRCWSVFMDAQYPAEPHFPARFHHVSAYAPFFRNGDTLVKYLQHVHFAERLLHMDRGVSRDLEAAAIRGACKLKPKREPAAFRREMALRLIQVAAAAGDLPLARLMAVSRTWLLRVQSEGIPLQLDGRCGLSPDDPGWHSVITVLSPAPRPRVRIDWRTRKNCPAGDHAERTCSCGSSVASQVLCGVCALLGQIAASRSAGSSPADRLFPALQGSSGRSAFHSVCAAVGAETAWHAFRRGMARDMLDGGSPLGEILLAGGWRSGAFLRYLARTDLDRRVALDHALADSDEEG